MWKPAWEASSRPRGKRKKQWLEMKHSQAQDHLYAEQARCEYDQVLAESRSFEEELEQESGDNANAPTATAATPADTEGEAHIPTAAADCVGSTKKRERKIARRKERRKHSLAEAAPMQATEEDGLLDEAIAMANRERAEIEEQSLAQSRALIANILGSAGSLKCGNGHKLVLAGAPGCKLGDGNCDVCETELEPTEAVGTCIVDDCDSAGPYCGECLLALLESKMAQAPASVAIDSG